MKHLLLRLHVRLGDHWRWESRAKEFENWLEKISL